MLWPAGPKWLAMTHPQILKGVLVMQLLRVSNFLVLGRNKWSILHEGIPLWIIQQWEFQKSWSLLEFKQLTLFLVSCSHDETSSLLTSLYVCCWYGEIGSPLNSLHPWKWEKCEQGKVHCTACAASYLLWLDIDGCIQVFTSCLMRWLRESLKETARLTPLLEGGGSGRERLPWDQFVVF